MRNQSGGKKHKKQGNAAASARDEMVFADGEQNYAQVTRILGHSKFNVIVYTPHQKLKGEFTAEEMIANVRPGLKKKRMFVNKDSILIVSKRDFQDKVCDILHVYTNNQCHILKKKNCIPVSLSSIENDDEVEFYQEKKTKDKENKRLPNTNYTDFMDDISDEESGDEEEKEVEYDDMGNIIG